MVARSLGYTLTTRLASPSLPQLRCTLRYIPLQVLQRMVTHSQFCMSGDNTIQATARAMRGAAEDAATDAAKAGDEGGDDDDDGTAAARNFIFVLSDANFRRYGLDPRNESFARYHPTPYTPLGTVSTLSRGPTPSHPLRRASRAMQSWSAR